MAPPTTKMGLPAQTDIVIKITPRNRYAQKPTSQVIIDSVELTTNTTTLKMYCVNLVCQTLLDPGAGLHLFPSCFATRRDGVESSLDTRVSCVCCHPDVTGHGWIICAAWKEDNISPHLPFNNIVNMSSGRDNRDTACIMTMLDQTDWASCPSPG